jgi:hypothetical protein
MFRRDQMPGLETVRGNSSHSNRNYASPEVSSSSSTSIVSGRQLGTIESRCERRVTRHPIVQSRLMLVKDLFHRVRGHRAHQFEGLAELDVSRNALSISRPALTLK